MCGIAGIIAVGHVGGGSLEERLSRMIGNIQHRGPDDTGLWSDNSAGVYLGHKRLSIVDLTPTGHQPMASFSGRYTIVFNGEIYNFQSIRNDIKLARPDIVWRGASDTEVLLNAIELWGVGDALKKLNGMFAFGLWDRELRQMTLARDRFGEKPLYYGCIDGLFVFGSELKVLEAVGGQLNIDPQSLASFMRYSYVPSPYSIYKGIYKLQSGHYLTVKPQAGLDVDPSAAAPFWSISDVVASSLSSPLALSDDELVDELDKRLCQSINQRMIADVPLGAFLSGGIDSSAIVALMQANSPRAVKTFSIGFENQNYNEANDALLVAQHLKTDHTEFYVTEKDLADVIPSLPSMYDEPFADSSQIPTHLVSRLAREHVTVALTGDAGDELFGGYNRYVFAPKLWGRVGGYPDAVKMGMASLLGSVSPNRYNKFMEGVGQLTSKYNKWKGVGEKAHKLAGLLTSKSEEELYLRLTSIWGQDDMIEGVSGPCRTTQISGPPPVFDNMAQRMMFLDAGAYMQDDVLCKVDRASMAASLETRVPFLDHNLFEFAWRIPLEQKIKDGQTKVCLRNLVYRYIPKDLLDRPKAGFAVPVGDFMRGSLREWAEDLLTESTLADAGFAQVSDIRNKWDQHKKGSHNWQAQLWNVLMYQSWRMARGGISIT